MIIRLFLVVLLLSSLFGCGKHPEPNQIKKFDGYTVIGYLDGGNKVITLYDTVGVVCIENAANPGTGDGSISHAEFAAFSCWDVETAPVKIKNLTRDLDR